MYISTTPESTSHDAVPGQDVVEKLKTSPGLLPAFVPQPWVLRSETSQSLCASIDPQRANASYHKRTLSEYSMLSPGPGTPSGYHSPMRHHRRTPSMRTTVKETLNARSENCLLYHRVNQYRLGREIGHGSYGEVRVGTDSEGHQYAVKEFSKSRMRRRVQSQLLRARGPCRLAGPGTRPGSRLNRPPLSPRVSVMDLDVPDAGDPLSLIRQEVAVMKKLHHENLVQLIEVLDDPEEDSLYMVLEMCQRGVVQSFDEDKRAKPLDEEKARHYFRDLILGIEYLHSQCIIHRDIKPENLLLSEDDVLKISDFGVSQMFADVRNEDMKISQDAGSPAFMAPELCRPKHGDVAGKAVDIWAMGVTLYCFRYGKIPFEEGDDPFEMYDNIRTKRHVLPKDESPEFVGLMDRILDKDPLTRIKMPELREHPWVTMSGIDPLLPEEENCAEFIDIPNELELSQALTRRTTNIFTVMKVLSKLKSRVAKRKALKSKSLQEPLSPVTQANLSESNAQLAAELARRRQHYKANKKRPSFLNLPVEDNLASPGSSSPHSDGPGPPVPFTRYLGIGTGSQYHVPKNNEDNDYVAESPTSINFSFSDLEGTHQYKSQVISESPNHTNTSSDWEDRGLCEHTMALRVDSGYGEISEALKKTN
ncbi:hypothetical protein Cpir12675_006265 [Ceratocystis pirilliformis]|uniref:Protein kinase domain-containing protein n=1 Tax=Ceratocystis pirilliformis TaxID=259994 RepID=A0ABR3YIL7_9PEZI